MRRFLALARTAALESLAEPLSSVVFLSALLIVHLAPAMHYHRFGEAARLPRECGLSALLVFGLVFATSAAVRTIGREISSGTASAALALSVPRPLFHCAKTAGVFAAFALFAAASTFATVLSARTSALGAKMALTGADVRLWGPGLALGVGLTILAFAAAAAANRFLRWRFCVSACVMTSIAQPVALVAAIVMGGFAEEGSLVAYASRLFPAFATLTCGCLVFVALAAALAVRLKPATVTAAMTGAVLASFLSAPISKTCPPAGAVIHALLPALSDFWAADRLLGGGALPAERVALLISAAALLVVFWLGIGSLLLSRRELP